MSAIFAAILKCFSLGAIDFAGGEFYHPEPCLNEPEILSRSSSRGQATPEVKITLIPFSAFTDDKVASKRNMMLTSRFLNIKSPLLQVVDDFVGVNVFYQNK